MADPQRASTSRRQRARRPFVAGAIVACAALVAAPALRAEPVVLGLGASTSRVSLAAGEAATLTGELAGSAGGELAHALHGEDDAPGEATGEPAQAIDAQARHETWRTARQSEIVKSEAVKAQREAAAQLPSPLDAGDEESGWDAEFKETLRPIYDELKDSGVVDAVQGIKTYLVLLGAIVPNERTATTAQHGDAAHDGESVVGWEARSEAANGFAEARTPALSEKDKLVATLLFEEMISTLKPWLLGLAAALLLWQGTRFAFKFTRWKSHRASRRHRRRGRSPRAVARQRAPG